MKIVYALIALVFSSMVSATNLNNIVVFGDSLSDTGNLYEYMKHQLPVSPPYYDGRFANGPVWIELFGKNYYPSSYDKHVLDYAFGGASVLMPEDDEDGDDTEAFFTLSREVDAYLVSHQDKADPNSLYVIWIGANNYLSAPENVDETVNYTVAGIKRDLKRLADKGAKHIMVLNLPDLGQTPAATDYQVNDLLTKLSLSHNQQLEKAVTELHSEYPGVQLLSLDIYSIMNDVLANPANYGFNNIHGTCYDIEDNKPSSISVLKLAARVKQQVSRDVCEGYMFFDPVHPTALAHKVLAERARQLLDASGIVMQE